MKKRLFALAMVAVLALGAFTGCSKKEAGGNTNAAVVESGKLQEFVSGVQEAYGENYYPNMDLSPEEIETTFGVAKEDMAESFAQMPMISVNVDTFVAIESAEGKADAVEEALTAYRENLIENSMQYPMNLPRINASVVHRVDNYVFFIILGTMDETLENEEDMLKFAQEQNQIAVDAINEVAGK